MSYASGTFTINSTGQPVVTGQVISSTVFNAFTADIATGLSTCVLKDGTQTLTANIPMSSFKFTGLAAGSASGNSLRYEQVNGVVTTAGDTLYATAAGTLARLAIGTARQQLATNSGTTAPEWVASLQSLMTTTGDSVQASSANTPARLAIGTAYQRLSVNAGATAAEWAADTQNNVVTTAGDIMQATGTRTIARLAIGTARQVPTVNAGATALAYQNPITLGTPVASTSGTAIDFTGLPAGVRRITISFIGVSLSSTSALVVQIGPVGGIETSGYLGTAGSGTTFANFTSSWGIINSGASASIHHGTVILNLENSAAFTWSQIGLIGLSNAATMYYSAGSKSLAAVLTQVRITSNGADTFDAGEINISYE